jgi:hypothetical protein
MKTLLTTDCRRIEQTNCCEAPKVKLYVPRQCNVCTYYKQCLYLLQRNVCTCYNAMSATATMQCLHLLQCNVCTCYNPMSASATMQYLHLLQCNVCTCYNAMSAPATMQCLRLLQCNVCNRKCACPS